MPMSKIAETRYEAFVDELEKISAAADQIARLATSGNKWAIARQAAKTRGRDIGAAVGAGISRDSQGIGQAVNMARADKGVAGQIAATRKSVVRGARANVQAVRPTPPKMNAQRQLDANYKAQQLRAKSAPAPGKYQTMGSKNAPGDAAAMRDSMATVKPTATYKPAPTAPIQSATPVSSGVNFLKRNWKPLSAGAAGVAVGASLSRPTPQQPGAY